MTKYNRVTGKVFGATASATGDNPEIGQFGSAKEGSYIGTSDISTIQALPAWGQGWAGAVTPETNFPPLPEMTGAMKVLSQQQCYLLQQGLAEWDSATIYYTNNFSAKNGKIYISLTNENQGNDPSTDTTNWKEFSTGGGLEVCDIGMALYVDETKGLRRYLNGQVIDINTNTQAFLNRLKEITTLHPSLLCTEEEWQTAKTMSAFGQVGKFVFNYSGDDIVSVRLPRVVNVQGLFDLQNLGMTVGAGLPNITGVILNNGVYAGSMNYKNGCITVGGQTLSEGGGGVVNNPNVRYANVTINASDSSSIYKDGATVQQEAIQYPYFIQIATGQETENNIINDIELNNPYSLFDSKYSDHELNNLSWLKSEGQWNAKSVYPTAYDKLLKVYNGTETVEGLSVKLSTETYTDYDFVLNTADETFRLPLKTKLASGKAVVGNGMTLGLTNGRQSVGLMAGGKDALNFVEGIEGNYGNPIGTARGTGMPLDWNSSVGVTLDPTKSGIETSDSGLYLYFYVGETVQNANLINAGRIGEQLATKTDMLQASGAGMPSNKYIDLTLGASGSSYTAPANGYFTISKLTNNANQNVTFMNTGKDGSFTEWGSNIINRCAIPSSGGSACTFIPASKGDIVKVVYTAGGNLEGFRFIYAEGSK